MKRFQHLLCVCSIALIACSTTTYATYSSQGSASSYGSSSGDAAGVGGAAGSDALSGIIQGSGAGVEGDGNGVPSPCNKVYPAQSIPYALGQKANTVSSSITYPQNKGEILIHRPAAIIVKRPPTQVLIKHPHLVVKPAPVILHKPPAVVLRKVYVKHHPRPVKVEPVYVNVVKPPAEKYFVNEKQQQAYNNGYASGYGAGAGGSGGASAAGSDAQAAAAGYQLLQGNQGLAALANIGSEAQTSYDGSNAGYSAGSSSQGSYQPAAQY
ncbi:chorion protein S38 [Eurosta solidaginis]|uniref:chorion protein S38 n=1 Tax=Eurosta solidaginis TaxID=178769 RepID=UPI003530A67A